MLAELSRAVLCLTCCGEEMQSLWSHAVEQGWVESAEAPVCSDSELRDRLKADVEVWVARDLFGLTREELRYVLSTFPIFARREHQRFGSYRFLELIERRFDELPGIGAADMSAACC